MQDAAEDDIHFMEKSPPSPPLAILPPRLRLRLPRRPPTATTTYPPSATLI